MDRYGLLARAVSANDAYLYGITCDGKYSLRIWDGYQFTKLIDWTPSEHILTGENQTNRLGFMAQDQKLSLYINGILAHEIEDNTFREGAFGLYISSANTQNFTVNVSKVAYWDLP